MPLSTSRQPLETILSADINAIANGVNRGAATVGAPKSGHWLSPQGYASGTGTGTDGWRLNRLYFCPWPFFPIGVAGGAVDVDRIQFASHGTAVADGTLRLGLYGSTEGQPDLSKLQFEVAQSAATIAVFTHTVAVSLIPGLYWVGFVPQSASTGVAQFKAATRNLDEFYSRNSNAPTGVNHGINNVSGALPTSGIMTSFANENTAAYLRVRVA